ncbi:MAG: hypothetical protein ACK5LC_04360 [Coprobacillaceae bacterium]
MNIKTKRVLSIIAIITSILTICLTIYFAKTNVKSMNMDFEQGDMGFGEPPSGELPDGDFPSGELPEGDFPDGEIPSNEAPNMFGNEQINTSTKGLTTTYIIVIAIAVLVFSATTVYMVMSKHFTTVFLKETRSPYAYGITTMVITVLLTVGIVLFSNKVILVNSNSEPATEEQDEEQDGYVSINKYALM